MKLRELPLVIPAEAGIQSFISCTSEILVFRIRAFTGKCWIPAYAGMTVDEPDVLPQPERIFDTCYETRPYPAPC